MRAHSSDMRTLKSKKTACTTFAILREWCRLFFYEGLFYDATIFTNGDGEIFVAVNGNLNFIFGFCE